MREKTGKQRAVLRARDEMPLPLAPDGRRPPVPTHQPETVDFGRTVASQKIRFRISPGDPTGTVNGSIRNPSV